MKKSNAQRRKHIKQILSLRPYDKTQTQLAREVGITQAAISKIFNSEEYQQMYDEQKRGVVQRAIVEVNPWFEQHVLTSKPRNSLEAVTVWAIMIDKIQKLSGEDNKWSSNNIQFGDKNITLEVSDNVKKIMEKIKK